MHLTLEQRRAYALDLLNNPLLGDILEGMKSSVLAQWVGTNAKDTLTREQAWMKVKAIDEVARAIESALAKAIEAEKATEEDSH